MESNLAMYKMFILVKSVVPLLGMYPKKVIPRKEAKLKLCGQRRGMQLLFIREKQKKATKISNSQGNLLKFCIE